MLDQAESKLDFVVGINLFVAPNNRSLKIDSKVAGCNNEIFVATEDLSIGQNDNINAEVLPTVQTIPQPTDTPPSVTPPPAIVPTEMPSSVTTSQVSTVPDTAPPQTPFALQLYTEEQRR